MELPRGKCLFTVSIRTILVCLVQHLKLCPSHNSSQVDALEGLTVRGQAIALHDMYDGMVLTTMAGYPLTIQLNPFRVNNSSMSMIERDLHFKNGIIQKFEDYPEPIVPWIGKSLLDVLVETSKHCKGDLSGFIALIEGIPSLFAKLQLQQEGTTAATTLFVPAYDALASFDPTLMAVRQQGQDFNPTILQLLQNHFVSGNFASQCWWTIPTGIRINDAELKMLN